MILFASRPESYRGNSTVVLWLLAMHSAQIFGVQYMISSQSKVTTPPTVFNSSVFDTPLKSTSGSQQGSEQVHNDVDDRILQEVNGCVYNGIIGFYEKYFEGSLGRLRRRGLFERQTHGRITQIYRL